jgi:glyoxylate carboligase
MAFVLKQSDTFSWPVTFDLPVDGGLHETQTFDVQFKRMPQKWIREIAKKIDAEKVTDTEVAREILAGWAGIIDDTGKDIPFSQKTLEQILDIPTLSGAVVLAYFKATAGVKEKN